VTKGRPCEPAGGSGPPEAPETALEARLGHRFADVRLLRTALTHPSYSREHGEGGGNERLEFLGDAVLGLAVAQLLYETFPEWPEGHLSRARAALVNGAALADRARALRLAEYARLGRSEQRGGGHEKQRILANLFEGVVGALYLDGGLQAVQELVTRVFGEALESGDALRERDPKTRLSEWAHAGRAPMPRYRVVQDSGVENADERFLVSVAIDDRVLGRGLGRTKQAAEQAAAAEALDGLARAEPGAGDG
jgi:ribonuclease-3